MDVDAVLYVCAPRALDRWETTRQNGRFPMSMISPDFTQRQRPRRGTVFSFGVMPRRSFSLSPLAHSSFSLSLSLTLSSRPLSLSHTLTLSLSHSRSPSRSTSTASLFVTPRKKSVLVYNTRSRLSSLSVCLCDS